MSSPLRLLAFLTLALVIPGRSALGIEFFGKGSISKNYTDTNTYTTSLSMTGGVAITLVPQIRLEARYTNISSLQNELNVVSSSVIGTLSDISTTTSIFSLGVDVDFLGEKSAFQPYIYLGMGYIETVRSYYFTLSGSKTSTYFEEPRQTGVSGNGGAGIRLRIASRFALELEAFAYAMNIQTNAPLINLYGTAGIRLFI